MKQNLPLNQAILTVEQLDKEYPFVDLLLDTERDIRNQIQFATDKGREEERKSRSCR